MTSGETRNAGDQSGGGQQSNVAQDEAHVDMQVGVMHGDAHFYHTQKETPQEKYRVGRNYLRGNAQQHAEKLICEAFMDGYQTTEVAWYWVLAILSGRSFDNLGQADFNSLSTAFRFAERHGPDRWTDATMAVSHLMACLVEQDSCGEPDAIKLGVALTAFEALPTQQRREIRRHLEMILAGGIQDRLDAEYEMEVRDQRMSGNRRGRAWKFFEPDPTEPRQRRPRPIEVAVVDWLRLAVGALISTGGLVLLLPLIARGAPITLVSTVLLCGAGGSCAVNQRWEWLRRKRLRDIQRAEREDIPDDDRLDEGEHDLTAQVKQAVDLEFGYFRPMGRKAWKEWEKRVKGIRNALRRELMDLYADADDIQPARWLIRWYARQAFREWNAGTLAEQYESLLQPLTAPLILAGTLAATTGTVIGLSTAFRHTWNVTLLAAPALLIGGCLLFPGATRAYLEWRRHADQLVQMTQRYEEQWVAYRTMVEKLRDRPTDNEMARWLDYDKAYARMLALRRYQLTNRNVIAHAVLIQGTAFCRMGRVPYGPPRYSSYGIHVFLLTDRGVRQVTVEVNFLNGLVHNERRMTFHYEAVTAMRVGEINVRLDGDRLPPPDRTGQRWLHQLVVRREESSRVAGQLFLSRTFVLSLVNDEFIAVRVVNFDEGLIDRMRENPWSMLELALDAAGLTGALHILEAVAAESKDWISREADRRARRLKTYQEEMGWLEVP